MGGLSNFQLEQLHLGLYQPFKLEHITHYNTVYRTLRNLLQNHRYTELQNTIHLFLVNKAGQDTDTLREKASSTVDDIEKYLDNGADGNTFLHLLDWLAHVRRHLFFNKDKQMFENYLGMPSQSIISFRDRKRKRTAIETLLHSILPTDMPHREDILRDIPLIVRHQSIVTSAAVKVLFDYIQYNLNNEHRYKTFEDVVSHNESTVHYMAQVKSSNVFIHLSTGEDYGGHAGFKLHIGIADYIPQESGSHTDALTAGRRNLAKAWDAILPLIIKYQFPLCKVVLHDPQRSPPFTQAIFECIDQTPPYGKQISLAKYLELKDKNPDHNLASLHKQITIFLFKDPRFLAFEQNPEQSNYLQEVLQPFITEVERELSQRNITPAVFSPGDRKIPCNTPRGQTVTTYTSYRDDRSNRDDPNTYIATRDILSEGVLNPHIAGRSSEHDVLRTLQINRPCPELSQTPPLDAPPVAPSNPSGSTASDSVELSAIDSHPEDSPQVLESSDTTSSTTSSETSQMDSSSPSASRHITTPGLMVYSASRQERSSTGQQQEQATENSTPCCTIL